MTHELKHIVTECERAKKQGIKAVLATVVALDGSSYRRPGVRMLLLENGKMVGAVSGGCVEKEVFRQAESVFTSGISKVMTYDGRYRLGCEGILYILLERMDLSPEGLEQFKLTLKKRSSFRMESFFEKDYTEDQSLGSRFILDGNPYPLQQNLQPDPKRKVFTQELNPCFRLVIIGGEHDAVQLCSFAAMSGWEVIVVVHPKEEKKLEDFPGAVEILPSEDVPLSLDQETAVVVMTHSYAKDIRYLLALQDKTTAYLGLLGPAKRREKLFNELMERNDAIHPDFLEHIHGPAGLDIGAETPQEIAISILSEILAVMNSKTVNSLREKEGSIHG